MKFYIVLVTSLLVFASSAKAALEIDSSFLKSNTGSSSVSMPVKNLIEIIKNIRLSDNSHPQIIGWTRKNNTYTFSFKASTTIKLTFVHLLNSGGLWSSIAATSDGKPINPIKLLVDLNAMPRDKTKFDLHESEEQKNELSELNASFFYPKIKGIYTEEFGDNDEATRTVNILKIYNGKADFDYVSKLNNQNVCVVPVRGATLLQDKIYKHDMTITSEGNCQIKLVITAPGYGSSSRDETSTSVEVKYRGDCDEYCNFGILTENFSNIKNEFYPKSYNMKDVKTEEMMKKKRKEAEASKWN